MQEIDFHGTYYVVWSVPGRQDLRGIHLGPGAWRGLVERLPHRRYKYSDGTRLRSWHEHEERRFSFKETVRAYFKEIRARSREAGVSEPDGLYIFVWA